MLTWKARKAVSPTTLEPARLSEECSDIRRRSTCSTQLAQWTWEVPLLSLIGIILSGNECQHQMLQLCCEPMTRTGLISKLLSIGLGTFFGYLTTQPWDIRIVCNQEHSSQVWILMQCTIALPLKNQCVLVGSFTLHVLPTDHPLNREDSCWTLSKEEARMEEIQFTSYTTMITLRVTSECNCSSKVL